MISFLLGLLYFGIAITVIVFVHELGHLMMAKKYGVHCHEFSIGMGPKLFEIGKDKSGTVYVVRAIPFGGYVHLAGEEDSPFDKDIPKENLLSEKKPYQKILILVAGATMNFILAFVLMFGIFFFSGYNVVVEDTNVVNVAQSTEGTTKYPAQEIGMESGDKILAINGVTTNSFEEISSALANSDDTATVTYEKPSGEVVTKDATLVDISCDQKGLGISATTEKEQFNFFGSIQASISTNVGIIGSVLQSLKLLFTGGAQVNDLIGPVGLATGSKEIVKTGFVGMLFFIAFLSVNIGFVNLLPFPALDGGRIVFALYELITRRKANAKVENTINMIGIMLLLTLMLVVTFSDILRLTYTDDYSIAISHDNVISCANPGEDLTFNLSVIENEDTNLEADSLVMTIEINDGIIKSYDGVEYNTSKIEVPITESQISDGSLKDKEIITVPNDNDSSIIELDVSIKKENGILKKTQSMDYIQI